jgi:hypothetical protein
MLHCLFKISFVDSRGLKHRENHIEVDYAFNDDVTMINAFNTVRSDYDKLKNISVSLLKVEHT